MTPQETIRRLKDHFRIHDDGRPTPYLDEAAQMAITALEKQIPKKPIKYSGKDSTKDQLACCPICDGCVDWTYNGFWRKGNPQYCKECGQKIDWS